MELKIEKLIYGGDGLAHGPADESGKGKAVFIPLVLPGERVEARVLEQKPGFLRAIPERLLEASEARVPPECPYFGACGGCHYQHTGYEQQVTWKAAILGETIQRFARTEPPPIAIHRSPPWHYRNRTRLKVQGGRSFAVGYFRARTHELLPIEKCPIGSPLINRAIGVLSQWGNEHRMGEEIQEIGLFANSSDDSLLIELVLQRTGSTKAQGTASGKAAPNGAKVNRAAEALRRYLPEIVGVAIFTPQAGEHNSVTLAPPEVIGVGNLTYVVKDWRYRVSGGSFFQTNRHLTEELLQIVTGEETGEKALDLYAGTGLFSLPLAERFQQITAVESSPFSGADLRHNVPPQVRIRRQEVEEFLQHGKGQVDLTVVDPPRTGLGEQVADALGRLRPRRITYVSCDPATLGRDLKRLLALGYSIREMHLVDLFPQTFHLESVTKLVLAS